jgi:hypothetical protein
MLRFSYHPRNIEKETKEGEDKKYGLLRSTNHITDLEQTTHQAELARLNAETAKRNFLMEFQLPPSLRDSTVKVKRFNEIQNFLIVMETFIDYVDKRRTSFASDKQDTLNIINTVIVADNNDVKLSTGDYGFIQKIKRELNERSRNANLVEEPRTSLLFEQLIVCYVSTHQ